jgi:hypothetical protein
MKKYKKVQNEEGFVLIAALLILLVLTVLGIAVNRNTNTEWRIAMNDRLHKETFYTADAVSELAQEVLEQSVACLGFGENNQGMRLPGAPGFDIYIESHALGFWRNYAPDGIDMPSDRMISGVPDRADRDIVFPARFDENTGAFLREATNNQPHTNIRIGGNTRLTSGSAIEFAAGYEGLGKGIGSGGATLVYDINIQQVGRDGSEVTLCVQYGHILGSSGVCNYN